MSSSLVAVNNAIEALQEENCYCAVAGGVNIILNPEVSFALDRAEMLSKKGYCSTFDEKADGYIRGEGGGLVILKRLDDAIADKDNILALIEASGIKS